MNDLAEKALHGLEAARREIAGRPVAGLGIAGFLVSAVVVVTGGRIGAVPAAVPLSHWLGLLPAAGYRVTGVAMGAVMLAAIGVLLALWVLTLHVCRARSLQPRHMWTIGAAWAAPFALGPPLLTTDVYRHVAAGELSRRGHSPYHQGPDTLGAMRLVDAIDPSLRSARSTDGPLAVLLSHLAVSVTGGTALVAVIVLRVIAVLSAIALGHYAMELAGVRRRATALGLTVLNPAVLLVVVSACLFTGIMAALLLAAIVAARQRRWWRAVLLACLAAGFKPIVLIAVVPIITLHVLGYPKGRRRLRAALRDTAVGAATIAIVVFTVPFGLGWADNLSAAARAHTPFAPAAVVADLMGFVVTSASYDDQAIGGRVAAAVAALTIVGYLFATARTRPLERTIGFALLAVGVLAPVLYPAYLLLAVLCLAPTATGARRDWVVALSCVTCVLTPVGLGERGGIYATSIALTVIGAGLLARWHAEHKREVQAERSLSAAG
jgi:hypothetical protein